VHLPFARSERSSVGIEWELALVDKDSGDLRQVAQTVLDAVEPTDGSQHPHIRQELLLNTVEVVSGVCRTVGDAGRDLEAAIDLAAARRPDAEIDVVGFSMGAAVAILVAAQDERVARVVADSPFADLRGVVRAAAVGMHVPPVPLVDLVDHVTGLRYGYRFAQVQPVQVVDRIPPRPLLLVHGTDDTVIPVEHAHRLAAAAGPRARLEIVPGVGHCGAYFADRPGYIAHIAEFLR